MTSRENIIYLKLFDNETNIEYAAAYLSWIQDIWKEAYPRIDGDTAILATLYNIGEYGSQGPHPDPQSRPFGDFARENYYHVKELLGLSE